MLRYDNDYDVPRGHKERITESVGGHTWWENEAVLCHIRLLGVWLGARNLCLILDGQRNKEIIWTW